MRETKDGHDDVGHMLSILLATDAWYPVPRSTRLSSKIQGLTDGELREMDIDFGLIYALNGLVGQSDSFLESEMSYLPPKIRMHGFHPAWVSHKPHALHDTLTEYLYQVSDIAASYNSLFGEQDMII